MVDYSNYSLEELLDVKNHISKESENYVALTDELDKRKNEIDQLAQHNEQKDYDLDKLKIKAVGYFQLAAGVILFAIIVYQSLFGTGFSFFTFAVAAPLIVLNALAGITALKQLSKWYWVSILNQCLQLLSFSLGSLYVNYAGLGYMNIILSWGQEFSLGFEAKFSPGFNFYKYTESLQEQFIAVDVFAILFILAFIRVRDFEART